MVGDRMKSPRAPRVRTPNPLGVLALVVCALAVGSCRQEISPDSPLGAVEVTGEVKGRIKHLRLAILDTPEADPAQLAELAAIESELNAVLVVLRGDRSKARRNEAVDPSLVGRINRVVEGQLGTTQPPTNTSRAGY